MASNNYGTVSSAVNIPNGNADASHPERTALLSGKIEEGGVRRRLRRHMTANVSNKWGDIALLFCYIITGLLDSTSVFVWGSFLSMQTGEVACLIRM